MKTLPITQSRCLGCEHDGVYVFFENFNVPVFCNVLWDKRGEALAASRASIRLGLCRHCGLIYNIDFDSALLDYSQRYENSLHYSGRFQAYVEELACKLIKKYRLNDKTVMEIGCGQGDFLSLLAGGGGNRAIGFDPGFDVSRTSLNSQSLVEIRCEEFDPSKVKIEADLICCRHVLEHIDKPLLFLRKLRDAIGEDSQAVLFFEVPNAMSLLAERGIWDIIYEHYSYFTAHSLRALFRRAGFEVLDSSEEFDGQFLTIEARVARGPSIGSHHYDCEQDFELISDFNEMYERKVDYWSKMLLKLGAKKQKIMAWGAGSKGVTFLNTFTALNSPGSEIKYIVDVNPHKQGKFVTAGGQEIVTPLFLKKYLPDYIILMNSIYRDEVASTLRKMGVGAEILLA